MAAVYDDDDGEPRRMFCRRCGSEVPFDENLPFVNQIAAFRTDHGYPYLKSCPGTEPLTLQSPTRLAAGGDPCSSSWRRHA